MEIRAGQPPWASQLAPSVKALIVGLLHLRRCAGLCGAVFWASSYFCSRSPAVADLKAVCA